MEEWEMGRRRSLVGGLEIFARAGSRSCSNDRKVGPKRSPDPERGVAPYGTSAALRQEAARAPRHDAPRLQRRQWAMASASGLLQ